jgi:type III secretion protein J
MASSNLHRGAQYHRLVVFFVCACSIFLLGCQEVLHTRLSELEANEVLAILAEEGIEAKKIPGDEQSWSISIDNSEFARAIKTLKQRGLPREKFESMGKIFKKDSLYSSANEERIRYQYAVQQELNDTLQRIDGVIDARVQFVLPANDPFASQAKPSSASVFIKHRKDMDFNMIKPTIRNLVRASIEGLSDEQIELSFFSAQDRVLLPNNSTATQIARSGGALFWIASVSTLILLIAAVFGWKYKDVFLKRGDGGRGGRLPEAASSLRRMMVGRDK